MKHPAFLALVMVLSSAAVSPAEEARGEAASRQVDLVWHVWSAEGGQTDSLLPDVPVNPASVVKAATTLWALERLGPERRFETRFGVRGRLDRDTGRLDGDLLVVGGDDPDFHVENAYLVAGLLNGSGIREVTGRLLVDDAFWIGWEGGSERKVPVGPLRVSLMAERLRDAFDPDRWDAATRKSIDEFGKRRGIDVTDPARVVIRGGVGGRGGVEPDRVVVSHVSNELAKTLKRFNSYSNNDIERLEPLLGSAEELTQFLRPRLGEGLLRLETLSGLGSNRMTPRQIVKLLVRLRDACAAAGMRLGDVLPVLGCDDGTLERFNALAEIAPGAITAKTGTLAETDGGVSVLAGLARARSGQFFFVVVAPQIRGRLRRARRAEQDWLAERLEARGGALESECGAPIVFSDSGVELTEVGHE